MVTAAVELDACEVENLLIGLEQRLESLKREIAECECADWMVSVGSLRADLQRSRQLHRRLESVALKLEAADAQG
jgi:hypothetical protein